MRCITCVKNELSMEAQVPYQPQSLTEHCKEAYKAARVGVLYRRSRGHLRVRSPRVCVQRVEMLRADQGCERGGGSSRDAAVLLYGKAINEV